VDQNLLAPLLLSAILAWAIYRRVRRNIGRQPMQVGRLSYRIAVFGVVGAGMLVGSARDVNLVSALLGGIAAGAALGLFGLRQTRFEGGQEGRFYTPHTYIGLFVSALFLARIAFRLFTVYLPAYRTDQPNFNPFAGIQRSPMTLALFGVLVGYYVVFNAGILRKSRNLEAPAVQPPTS